MESSSHANVSLEPASMSRHTLEPSNSPREPSRKSSGVRTSSSTAAISSFVGMMSLSMTSLPSAPTPTAWCARSTSTVPTSEYATTSAGCMR